LEKFLDNAKLTWVLKATTAIKSQIKTKFSRIQSFRFLEAWRAGATRAYACEVKMHLAKSHATEDAPWYAGSVGVVFDDAVGAVVTTYLLH
jgi:hypothetical protein